MTRNMPRFAWALAVGLLLPACSSKPPPAPLAAVGQFEPMSPFELRLLDEVNDGERLHIRGQVTCKVKDPASWTPTIARLTTVRQDGVRRSVYQPVAFKEQEPAEITLVAPILGVTDYQVELLWGEEASAVATRPNLEVVSSKLEVQPTLCPQEPCPVTLLLKVDLENLGLAEVKEATLGVTLVGPDAVALAPEDLVAVKDLAIVAGNHHNLEIEVASEVSPETAQRIYPKVRLVPGVAPSTGS